MKIKSIIPAPAGILVHFKGESTQLDERGRMKARSMPVCALALVVHENEEDWEIAPVIMQDSGGVIASTEPDFICVTHDDPPEEPF